MSVVAFNMGESSAGSYSFVLVGLFDCLQTRELSAVVEELACYSFGLVTGLARETYCLAAVQASYLFVRLTPQLAAQLLQPFEAVRLGTEVFFP